MHLVSSGVLSLSAFGWAREMRRLTILSRTLFRASCLRFSSASAACEVDIINLLFIFEHSAGQILSTSHLSLAPSSKAFLAAVLIFQGFLLCNPLLFELLLVFLMLFLARFVDSSQLAARIQVGIAIEAGGGEGVVQHCKRHVACPSRWSGPSRGKQRQ